MNTKDFLRLGGGRGILLLNSSCAAATAQNNLVTVLGEFMPKLVKMAPSGERPED
jgi:hypothetical protein